MEAWALTASFADFVLDAALVGGSLVLATLLRRFVPFLQRYLVPNALVAGFLGLAFGPQLVDWVPVSVERMGAYVYHLLALTFICVGLQGGRQRRTYGAVNLGFMQVMSMLLQALVGLAVVGTLWYLFDSELRLAAGILLPLGFAMGPGVAYSIGSAWQAFGFAEGGSVGLSLAAIGFLIAYVLGVLIVHRAGYKGDSIPRSERTGIRTVQERTVAGHLTISPGAVEPLAVHVSVVAAVYAATYGLATLLAGGLVAIGAETEVPIVWSFHFILANLIALSVRKALDRTGVGHVLDAGLLDRMTGLLADFLIAASIMAISLAIAWRYALPIGIMVVAGTGITYVTLRWTAERVFAAWRFERFVGMFGEMTGTVTSGLALIRILDPEYRSPVAQDLVLSSGMALIMGFPLLISINLPYSMFDGEPIGFAVLAGILLLYLVFILGAWRLFYRRTRGTEAANT